MIFEKILMSSFMLQLNKKINDLFAPFGLDQVGWQGNESIKPFLKKYSNNYIAKKLKHADLKYQNSVQLICEGVETALMEELEACQEFITLPGLSYDIALLMRLVTLISYNVSLIVIMRRIW